MSGLSSKISRIAQAGFVISLLILAIGTAKLFASGPNPTSHAIDRHMPFAYAFFILVFLSVLFSIVATIINWRSRTK